MNFPEWCKRATVAYIAIKDDAALYQYFYMRFQDGVAPEKMAADLEEAFVKKYSKKVVDTNK